jgi:sugar (pentulose or hexulose) kinase
MVTISHSRAYDATDPLLVGEAAVNADLVLGIDCSTTASKAVAWNRDGVAVVEGRAPLSLITPQPGWGEQDARQWWEATVNATAEVTKRVNSQRIGAICVTHQRETFVPVDSAGDPLRNGILWLDERSRTQLAALDRQFGGDALHSLTGRPPSMTQSLPKLVWLTEHEPDVIRKARHIVDVHAFLVHRLTGNWITSLASADPMGIVDMQRGAWASNLIAEIGLREEQFVAIAPPGTVIGAVTADAAAQTGLRSGTPVIAGAGDGQSASLGAGITGPGRAFVNLGTAVAGGALSDRYVTDRAFRTCVGPIPGTFVLESVLRGGTATVSWFMDHFADSQGDGDIFETYEREAATLRPGADGLVLVPYWNTVMNPYWDPAATGLVIGWTTAHRRHHLYRAILDGIAFEHRLAMEGIAASTEIPLTEHVILGGGSRSPLWRQIIADVLGARVLRARSADATNLGAAVLAAWAAGWFSTVADAARAMTDTTEIVLPHPDACRAYDRLYGEVYVHLFPAIRGVMNRLTELTTSPDGDEVG